MVASSSASMLEYALRQQAPQSAQQMQSACAVHMVMSQVCEQCQAVRQERQQEELTVHVEPGMVEQQVCEQACAE